MLIPLGNREGGLMGTRAIFSGIVALAASLAFASAQAATLTVTTTADPSTADGGVLAARGDHIDQCGGELGRLRRERHL